MISAQRARVPRVSHPSATSPLPDAVPRHIPVPPTLHLDLHSARSCPESESPLYHLPDYRMQYRHTYRQLPPGRSATQGDLSFSSGRFTILCGSASEWALRGGMCRYVTAVSSSWYTVSCRIGVQDVSGGRNASGADDDVRYVPISAGVWRPRCRGSRPGGWYYRYLISHRYCVGGRPRLAFVLHLDTIRTY